MDVHETVCFMRFFNLFCMLIILLCAFILSILLLFHPPPLLSLVSFIFVYSAMCRLLLLILLIRCSSHFGSAISCPCYPPSVGGLRLFLTVVSLPFLRSPLLVTLVLLLLLLLLLLLFLLPRTRFVGVLVLDVAPFFVWPHYCCNFASGLLTCLCVALVACPFCKDTCMRRGGEAALVQHGHD